MARRDDLLTLKKPTPMGASSIARAVSTPRPGVATITAFGETMTLQGWSARTGVPKQALLSRTKSNSGWSAERIVSEPYIKTNTPLSAKLAVAPGEPGSLSWSVEPWSSDPAARAFVAAHPGGATVEVCCAAMGLGDSQLRDTERDALHKIRVAALRGDADALAFIGSLARDDRDAEDLADLICERFPRADQDAMPYLEVLDERAADLADLSPTQASTTTWLRSSNSWATSAWAA